MEAPSIGKMLLPQIGKRGAIRGGGEFIKAVTDHVDLNGFMEGVKKRNPHQPEFVQAVQEVAEDIFEFMEDKEEYRSQ